jgi:hypothetical protein
MKVSATLSTRAHSIAFGWQSDKSERGSRATANACSPVSEVEVSLIGDTALIPTPLIFFPLGAMVGFDRLRSDGIASRA